MTTLNLQVSANNDDAHEDQAGTGFDAGTNNCLAFSDSVAGNRDISGHRLTSVTVPKGADIITATIQIWPTNTSSDDVNIDIFAEDVDDAVDFSTDPDVFSRVLTSASVSWVANSIGNTGFVTSPEIKAVIQEIVDRGS